MKKTWDNERGFIITFLAIWIAGFIVFLNISKGTEILWIQNHYFGITNWIFTNLTLVVEIPFCVSIIFIILLLASYQKFVFLVLNYLLTGGILLWLKEYFEHDRPFIFFNKQDITLHYLPHIDPLFLVSFPSGHSEAAIVFAFTISLIVKKQVYKMLIAIVALLACFSRVYLMQHFLQDILAGSLLGFTMSIVWLYLYEISFGRKIADYGLWYTLKKALKK